MPKKVPAGAKSKIAKVVEDAIELGDGKTIRKHGPSTGGAADATRSAPHSGSGPKTPAPTQRHDRRDARGRFTGSATGYARDKEAQGLDVYELGGNLVHREQRMAHHPDAENGRFYDGLGERPDGDLDGVEVKSGGASKNGPQRDFDSRVTPGSPAYVTINGKQRRIVNVEDVRVR